METETRKRSPRAPSLTLSEALERALKVYESEGKHPAPADVVAKHIGYKTATNGAAAQAIASLRYYGLLERPRDGFLAASRDVEAYKFSPNEDVRRELVIKWLKTPPLFSELLGTYQDSLPSEGTLKFDLIQRGFNPSTADECVSAFLDSVKFAGFYDKAKSASKVEPTPVARTENEDESEKETDKRSAIDKLTKTDAAATALSRDNNADQIPVRLAGGRRAWLVIPSPFYEADKKRLIAQIDLLLTDEADAPSTS